MIKLINYLPYGVTKEEYISKSCIHSTERKDDFTHICMDGGHSLRVKETPEEILAMPDIETTEKVIDWEQRRYEIANNVIGKILSVPYFLSAAKDNPIESLVSLSIRITDALINELKKGGEKCEKI